MDGTARVFMSGRSQAVCIPKRFRFDGDRVAICRKGKALILSPLPTPSWDEFFKGHTCPDFELDRSESQRPSERTPFA